MRSTGEGILDGMKQSLIAGIGLEEFQEKVSKAIQDGASPEELIAMGEAFAAETEQAIVAMGPAFDAVAEAFGLKTEEEVTDAIAEAAKTSKELIGSSLRSVFNDPKNLTYDNFELALRQAVYGNIVDGLIAAFIDAAVIQGALAPMLAVITAEFGNLGVAIAAGSAEGIAAASAIIVAEVGKIAGIIDDPAFQKAITTLLDLGKDIAQGLGLSLENTTDTINTATDGFNSAADAAANACTGECDLEQKLVTTDEKIQRLDAYGRTGGVSDSYWEDVPGGPTYSDVDRSIPDNKGGGGRYGDWNWSKSKDWRRDRSRSRRERRGYGPPSDDGWWYDDDVPWTEPPHLAAGGIVTRPTYALIGEAGPEAVVPLNGQGESELVRELREIRAELRAHGDRTVGAINADRHTEFKMGEDVLIDAWEKTKRVADKAGIPFGGDR